MRKKLVWIFLLFFCLIGGLYSLWPNRSYYDQECPFCEQQILDSQKFYEDDLCYCLYTHRPIVDGHCLIVPKRHVERFEGLTDEEALRVCQLIRKVDVAATKVFGTSSYLLLQKNGKEVGQSVPHVHVHYLPRLAGDDSVLKFLFQMFAANAFSPIGQKEMNEKVAAMKTAMN